METEAEFYNLCGLPGVLAPSMVLKFQLVNQGLDRLTIITLRRGDIV